MHIEEFREYCLSKKGVTESLPFNEDVLVFKVLNKMFALTSLSSEEFKVSLKCKPDKALELREEYESITPAFHMNKKHWNSVNVETLYKDTLFIQLVQHSYELVVKGMTKKDKEVLQNM